jgi:hypothetical protein
MSCMGAENSFCVTDRNTVALASLGSVFPWGTHRELMLGMKS